MDFTDNGIIILEKGIKKKIKCKKFYCKPIERFLMVHEDVDNKNLTNVSDFITGYRLFSLNTKCSQIKSEQIKERLAQFIKHFTTDGIAKEFKRVEKLLETERK